MPLALYCGPKRRKTGAPSPLESFVDVPRAWLSNQLGIDIVPVDLNLIASETLPEGNPFRGCRGRWRRVPRTSSES